MISETATTIRHPDPTMKAQVLAVQSLREINLILLLLKQGRVVRMRHHLI
jgi:hypothetical protein